MRSKTAAGPKDQRYGRSRGLHGALAVILSCLLAFSATTEVGAEQRKMTDQGIADAIENEIMFDRAVSLNSIHVRVSDGVATLTGSTDNLLERERAARLAETVKGVQSVVNRIAIEPYWGRMDWEIERDVENALAADPAADAYEIEVEVEDNEVILSGMVDSWQERRLAEQVAKGVRGVTWIDNRITVDFKLNRPDAEIRHDVEQALHWNTLVDDALIDVDVGDGRVEMTGTVGSAAEKHEAHLDAWVAGVHEVDLSGLEVEPWARDPHQRKTRHVALPDEEVAEAVRKALLYDPRVLSVNVDVDVQGGVATLRGEVDNLKAKRSAEQDARSTLGVLHVVNRLKVRTTPPIADEIERNIAEALLRDPFVERHEIDVDVKDGVAYLSGVVDSYFEKGRADDLASRTRGVQVVRNKLVVEYDQFPLAYDAYVFEMYPYGSEWYDYQPRYTFTSDRIIKKEISDELWWSPFVDSDQVKVEVDNGVARLTGTVDSWLERDAAMENALEGGAVWVDNDLIVK